jgi:conjugal transfer mating pair stabilization protein TraN
MEKEKLLPKNILRIVSTIVLFNFIVVHIVLDGRVYAQDFNSALDQGKAMGNVAVSGFNPSSLNSTMQNRGIGSTDDITPKMNDALQQQNNYQDFYSNPANMANTNTSTEVNDFVTNTAQTRQAFDLSKDTTFGNRCLQYDADRKCTMWSASSDLIDTAYPDCTKVIIPQYDAPPMYETCTGTDMIEDITCNVRSFAVMQTEIINTPCNQTAIDYKPGQIYAVCKDYYDYYRELTGIVFYQDDCDCGNHPDALCQPPSNYNPPPVPEDARLLGTSYENYRGRDPVGGDWDYCTSDRYNYYTKYRNSVIERVIQQYDSPCGETLNQKAKECNVWSLEQCDTGGLNCNAIVSEGAPTGVDPTADPRACSDFSGSIENYQICLNYDAVKINGRQLTNTPQTETTTTSDFGNTINWTRVYGGSDIRPIFNNWYTKVSFKCNNISDDCKSLKDQGCVLYSQKCTDLNCDNYEYTYRCGGTGNIKSYEKAYNCLGDVKCMGTECKDALYSANTDFASAAAATEVLNQYRADSTNTEIFPGEEQVCMSNPKDCCETPDGGMSIGDYVQLGRSTIQAYSLLNGGSAATWASYADAFTYASTLGESGTLSGLTGIGSSANSVNIVTSVESVGSTGGATLESMGYTASYQSGGTVVYSGASSAVSALATIATVATIAFVIYTIASYVYNWVYQCEEEDVVTSQKDGMRLCHELGRRCVSEEYGICFRQETVFCCYNSILARVLHEQARPQINKPWGSPEEPNCGGFTPGELASIDFSKIDLSEYMQYVTYNLSISPEKYQEIVDKTRNTINEKNQGQ